MLLWGTVYFNVLLGKGDEMAFNDGPTLLTYEEWWKWESKRLKAGKAPSRRSVTKCCNYCKKRFEEYHICAKFNNSPLSNNDVDLFGACDQVRISYERDAQ